MSRLEAAHAALSAALRGLRNPDGGWPYYHGRRSRLESTCWAVLALGEPLTGSPVASWIQPDGLAVEPSTGVPNHAFNALAALVAGRPPAASADIGAGIVAALLAARGEVVAASPLIRQDVTLQAWSWTPGTFTWIEPTSWCLLAVKARDGRSDVARWRIETAEHVMRDRECPGGGWNFGNGEVYGKGLPAHVPTTALGVLAMQDHTRDPLVERAVAFLESHALVEASTSALALSALALAAIGRQAGRLVTRLADHADTAIAFGNVAAMAMAACALAAALTGERPRALSLGGTT